MKASAKIDQPTFIPWTKTPPSPANCTIFTGRGRLRSTTNVFSCCLLVPSQEWNPTSLQVDPHDVWLGPQHQLTAYDAAWTFTPKKLLLAAYARPHSRAQLSKLRQEKETRGKEDHSCWLEDDSCSAGSYRVRGPQHHLSLPKPV
jgi:hypothetical protein